MSIFHRTALASLTVACLALPLGLAASSCAHAQAAKDAPAAAAEEALPVKQFALTDKQIQGVLAAQKEMDAVTDKLPEGAADKPDPKIQAALEAVAKKHGFASYAEYSDVLDNIGLVLSGIDPKTKAFTQPPDALKAQIAALQADAKMAAKNKQAALAEMNAALKSTPTVQFPDNVTLVTKYYDKLSALLQSDE
jgi:hypothetical protein